MKILLLAFILFPTLVFADCEQLCTPRIQPMTTDGLCAIEAGRLTCVSQCKISEAIVKLANAVEAKK